MSAKPKPVRIQVEIDDGDTFEFTVDTHDVARLSIRAVGTQGYFHNDGKTCAFYPVHRIKRVVVVGGLKTMYPCSKVTKEKANGS